VPVAALDPLAPHPAFACNAVPRRRVSDATVSFLICAPGADNWRFVREPPTYYIWEWMTAARPYVAQIVATDLHLPPYRRTDVAAARRLGRDIDGRVPIGPFSYHSV
jgi:hypothetical protein